jgi:hypothetical protein
MPIPKKRKKLDETIDPIVMGSVSSETPKETPKMKKTSPKVNKAKVDSAFEVMDKVDKNITNRSIELKKVNAMVPFQGSEGIHIKFKIDMIRWQDFVEGGKKVGEDEGIVIDFTIPYPWNLPIVGDVTKAVIKELVKLRIL